MIPLMAIGGLAKGAMGLITALRQKKAAKEIEAKNPEYVESPYARQRLGLATQMMNGRSRGVARAEQNIGANQSNAAGIVDRNAMDSGTALSMAAANQGQADSAYSNLAIGEDQLSLQKQNMVAAAQQSMVNEGDKIHEDRTRTFDNERAEKAALLAASQQNASSAIGGITGAMGSIGGLMAKDGGNFWNNTFDSDGNKTDAYGNRKFNDEGDRMNRKERFKFSKQIK